MTDDEIERVARAIFNELLDGDDPVRCGYTIGETLAVARAARAAIREPELPADCVRVRVAVAISPDATEAWHSNDMAETLAVAPPGSVGHWLTADLPRPVVREVAARVEEA